MYIYLTVTKTPTIVGKVIRQVLGNKYNHMSISLKEDLSELYSFGRVSVKNFVAGGPIKESYYTLSLGTDADVELCVFKIPVNKTQYDKLEEFIHNVFYDIDGYVYNLADAIGTIFHRRIKIDKCYTCIEFCRDAFLYAGIICSSDLNSAWTLDEARNQLKHFIIYEGKYREYPDVYLKLTENDVRFMKSRGFYTEIAHTAESVKKFVGRVYHTKILK